MKRSLKHGAGYLVIDHRDSPGVTPADVAHVPGQPIPPVGQGQLYEVDVLTCAHCQTVVLLNLKRTRPRGFCAKCNHYICDNPVCHATCAPIAKVFDEAEALAAHGLVARGQPRREAEDARADPPRLLLTDKE